MVISQLTAFVAANKTALIALGGAAVVGGAAYTVAKSGNGGGRPKPPSAPNNVSLPDPFAGPSRGGGGGVGGSPPAGGSSPPASGGGSSPPASGGGSGSEVYNGDPNPDDSEGESDVYTGDGEQDGTSGGNSNVNDDVNSGNPPDKSDIEQEVISAADFVEKYGDDVPEVYHDKCRNDPIVDANGEKVNNCVMWWLQSREYDRHYTFLADADQSSGGDAGGSSGGAGGSSGGADTFADWLASFAGSDGILQTDELREVIDAWRSDSVSTEQLRTAVDAWRGGNSLNDVPGGDSGGSSDSGSGGSSGSSSGGSTDDFRITNVDSSVAEQTGGTTTGGADYQVQFTVDMRTDNPDRHAGDSGTVQFSNWVDNSGMTGGGYPKMLDRTSFTVNSDGTARATAVVPVEASNRFSVKILDKTGIDSDQGSTSLEVDLSSASSSDGTYGVAEPSVSQNWIHSRMLAVPEKMGPKYEPRGGFTEEDFAAMDAEVAMNVMLVDENGDAISGETVTAYNEATGRTLTGRTDSYGVAGFKLKLKGDPSYTSQQNQAIHFGASGNWTAVRGKAFYLNHQQSAVRKQIKGANFYRAFSEAGAVKFAGLQRSEYNKGSTGRSNTR